jgi:maltose alpha-D-glucosyltransferase/alpha-amylase
MIRMRKECPEIGWGDYEILRTNVAEALVLKYNFRNTSMVFVYHFADREARLRLQVPDVRGHSLVDVFSQQHSDAQNDGCHELALKPYDWRWYRVGAADNALDRTAF